MLTSIQVRNFAIIDAVEIEFGAGMTVLTGETGAGKSILVDSLGFVLGERGNSGLVRTGAKRAEFTAEFDLAKLPAAREWLEEQMLDQDDECNLRRVIGTDGRSRAFINGNSVPLQSLKTLGEMLLDIHGQHFHQSLARRDVQRNVLDYCGGLTDLSAATSNAFNEWSTLAEQLIELESADNDRSSRLELLRFQLGEMDTLDLQPGEYEALSLERSKLQNSGRLAEGVSLTLQRLYDADEGNAQSLLAEATQTIESLAAVDTTLASTLSILQEATIHVSEAAENLRRYGDSLDMDPARQNWVEERLDAIVNIARKHRIEPEEIYDLHSRLSKQLDDLLHVEERGAELQQAVSAAEKKFRSSAGKLSAGRKNAGKAFSTAVTAAGSRSPAPHCRKS